VFTASTCFAQNNPVPFINQPLVPGAVAPGGPEFSLTVNGAGFVSGSIVNWNKNPLVTTFISASKLKAVVPADYVSNDATARVTVVNPGPGGGSSDPVPFTVTEPTSTLVFRSFPIEGMGITSPISLVTADFNHDGIADLAVIDQAPAPFCNYFWGGNVGSIAILLGNGDGTFSRASSLCSPDWPGVTPERLAITGDLNRDGNVDLIVVFSAFIGESHDEVYYYYGNGDGTFTAPPNAYLFGDYLQGLALGDFCGNGQLDFAISEFDDFIDFNGIYVYSLCSYDLVYGDRKPFLPPAGSLISGDFNGDGILDLGANSGNLMIFLNKGKGVFRQLPSIPFGGGYTPMGSGTIFRPPTPVTGDFNGDGILDLGTVNGNTISVLLGKGDGTFTAKAGQPVSAQTNVSLISTDINGDGKLDLVVLDSASAVSVWLGNGDGTFQAPRDTTGRGDGVVAADFNGDGRMDLAVTNSVNGTVSILLQGPPYKALVESPINADGTSVFSAKRGVVPVKFTLTENGVPTCTMPPATIALTRTAGGTLGSVDDSVYANPSDTGSNFRIDRSTCQYVYNLATRSLGVGTYRVDISINGYVVGHAVFTIQ
jgi:hypothetical protein